MHLYCFSRFENELVEQYKLKKSDKNIISFLKLRKATILDFSFFAKRRTCLGQISNHNINLIVSTIKQNAVWVYYRYSNPIKNIDFSHLTTFQMLKVRVIKKTILRKNINPDKFTSWFPLPTHLHIFK